MFPVPEWARQLGAAVWASDPERRLCFVNEEASDLLGTTERAVLGLPCFEVVAGKDPEGRPFCREDCPFLEEVERGEKVPPQTLQVDRDGEQRFVQVLCIPWYPQPGRPPGLIHVALDVQSCARMRSFLERVAQRDHPQQERPPAPAPRRPGVPAPLSPREQEVLTLLVAGEDLHGVARKLHVSYVTVRNHVQHILGKLHAHSVLEVVARTLLQSDGSPFEDPRAAAE